MTDKDQLIAMGFEPARVECINIAFAIVFEADCIDPGALRATKNRGLQPAMDHLFENEGKPIPAAGSEPAAPSEPRPDAMDVDEDDEDAEALRAALKLSKGGATDATAASSQDVGDAKVRIV
jgi:hypothetical protein